MDAKEHPIPLFYRIVLLYIEPLLALNGAILCLAAPARFLDAVSPHHPLANASSPSSSSSSPYAYAYDDGDGAALHTVRILTDMLGIFQLVFAFNLAVTLRVAGTHTRLWRVMCAGMLVSDILTVAVSVREYGAGGRGGRGIDMAAWRAADWLNFGILTSMGVVRAGVVLGIGLGGGSKAKVS